MISPHLHRSLKIQWLESLLAAEVAYWLIHSFSPERYNNPDDVIAYALTMLHNKSRCPKLADEFEAQLWAMFKMEKPK
jgi:hypothetical protein